MLRLLLGGRNRYGDCYNYFLVIEKQMYYYFNIYINKNKDTSETPRSGATWWTIKVLRLPTLINFNAIHELILWNVKRLDVVNT